MSGNKVEQLRPDIKSRLHRAWIISSLIVLVLSIAMSFVGYYVSVTKKIENFSVEEDAHIVNLKQRIEGDLNQLIADVMILRGLSHPVPLSQQLLLIETMEQLCNHKNIYSQFGFYDLMGVETIRIECKKDQAVTRNKANSVNPPSLLSEFQYISKLEDNEFHLSKIVIEPGDEQNASLALSTPLTLSDGQKNGYLVAYYRASLLAKDLWEDKSLSNLVNQEKLAPHKHSETKGHQSETEMSPLLHDHNGIGRHSGHMFILNSYGFPLGTARESLPSKLKSFESYYPAIWSVMKTQSSGSIKSEYGLFNYQSFNPLSAVKSHEALLHGRSYRFSKNYDRNWILLSYLSPQEVATLSQHFWTLLFLLFPIFIIVTTCGIYYLLKMVYVRIQAGLELVEKESHLSTIKDSMADGVLLCNNLGIIISANPSAAEIFGFRTTELEGLHIKTLIPMSSEGGHDQHLKQFFASVGPKLFKQRMEVLGVTKMEGEIYLEVTVTKTHDSGHPLALIVVRDINEQKATDKEMENLRLKYFHREKMAEMGMLVGGVLHEVGNPIASIQGLLNAMISEDDSNEKPLLDDSFRQYIDMVVEQTARIQTISRQISGFISPRSGGFELLDLNTLISSTSSLLSYDNRWRDIQMDTSLDTQLPAVEAIGDQIIQVMMNLLVNAADAVNEKFSDNAETDKALIRISSGRVDDKNIYFSVKDNGCGINKEKVGKIFDAFYTTKAEGKGTGLGLALCESIVDNHNGEIEIDSISGQGTEVKVYLPVSHQELTSE